MRGVRRRIGAATLTANTLARAEELRRAGMVQIDVRTLAAKLEELGYAVDKKTRNDYVNSNNGPPYRERTQGYTELATGRSFAHYQTQSPTLQKLQEFRRWHFVYLPERIWSL